MTPGTEFCVSLFNLKPKGSLFKKHCEKSPVYIVVMVFPDSLKRLKEFHLSYDIFM